MSGPTTTSVCQIVDQTNTDLATYTTSYAAALPSSAQYGTISAFASSPIVCANYLRVPDPTDPSKNYVWNNCVNLAVPGASLPGILACGQNTSGGLSCAIGSTNKDAISQCQSKLGP